MANEKPARSKMLDEYAKKRSFSKTSEPPPAVEENKATQLEFVVQKHDASHLHYDFRLELDGVLVSWAVPKGPSLDPKIKRLAVKVEDHPFGYRSFEGTIPEGQYGAGDVIVWDRGTYAPDDVAGSKKEQEIALRRGLEEGKLAFTLHGSKLTGSWTLVHMRDNQWLLMKHPDNAATAGDVLKLDQSVLSGQRIRKSDTSSLPPAQEDVQLQPMLLGEVDKPFSKSGWTFELKLDGVRMIAFLEEGSVRLLSRNGNEVTSRFPTIVTELASLSQSGTVLDGEAVQFDKDGRPDFQGLMQGFQSGHVSDATYLVFDILKFKGKDIASKTWNQRRKVLTEVVSTTGAVKILDTYPEEGEILYEQALALGFEGIVAKRVDSRYKPGIRTQDWLKIKPMHTGEFTVGGFTQGRGERSKTFGALILGEQKGSSLRYAGKMGTGFDDEKLVEIRTELEKLRTDLSPFEGKVPLSDPIWVQPKLVAEVQFGARTKQNKLRFPVFVRMRPDREGEFDPMKSETKAQASVTAALASGEPDLRFEIDGHELHLSSLDKELWPGITKRDLASYYLQISDAILPTLFNRPLSFVRCPDGIGGQRFFQKHWDKGRPAFVETISIYSDSNDGARDFVMCNNLATLIWLAQIAAIDLNPWDSHIVKGQDYDTSPAVLEASVLNRPDYLVLDLDPHFGGKASAWKKKEWLELVDVAFTLREVLDGLEIKAFPKSSGKSGLHLYVPTEPDFTYEEVRGMARVFGEKVEGILPGRVTLEWNTKRRPDGVFIDINQNVRGKTMAAPYSPRASENAGVSMPLEWDELKTANPNEFNIATAVTRIVLKGDLWQRARDCKQRLLAT